MEIENHATIFLMVNMASGIDHGSMRPKTATQHGSHIPANRSTEAFRPGLHRDSRVQRNYKTVNTAEKVARSLIHRKN